MAFNNFPYTDGHELNLDWVIKTVKNYVAKTAALEVDVSQISAKVDNFIASLDIPEEVRRQIDELISSGEFEDMILQTIEDNYGNDNIYARLHGKTIIVIGDSLTIGSGQAYQNTWLEMIRDIYDATIYNYGISDSKISNGGTQMSSNDMCSRIDNILTEHPTCDYFIVQGGANDKNYNVPIGMLTSTSNSDFCGAIKNMIVKIQRRYGKACQPLFMTTYHRFDSANDLGLREEDYVDAMLRCCAYFSIPCFDNFRNCGISLALTNYNNPQNLWADRGYVETGTRDYHFSVAGYEYLTPKYAAFISSGYIQNSFPVAPMGADVYTETLDNGWTVNLQRSILPDGRWLINGRIYKTSLSFNQTPVATDGDWYSTDLIEINWPEAWRSTLNAGVVLSWRGNQGICIVCQANSNVNGIGFRVLRYASSGAVALALIDIVNVFDPPTQNPW